MSAPRLPDAADVDGLVVWRASATRDGRPRAWLGPEQEVALRPTMHRSSSAMVFSARLIAACGGHMRSCAAVCQSQVAQGFDGGVPGGPHGALGGRGDRAVRPREADGAVGGG